MVTASHASGRHPGCPLCEGDGGEVIARNAGLRVVRTDEGGFPAFYRVIWNAHVAEFSDLPADGRAQCMEAVAVVEQALRAALSPLKINLASLGNAVPHLHWHVIARFAWDSHYPAPVWSAARREPPSPSDAAWLAVRAQREALHHRIAAALASLATPTA